MVVVRGMKGGRTDLGSGLGMGGAGQVGEGSRLCFTEA